MQISHRAARRAGTGRGRGRTGALLVLAAGAGVTAGIALMIALSDGRLRGVSGGPGTAGLAGSVEGGTEAAPRDAADPGLDDLMRRYEDGVHLVVDAPDHAYPLVPPKLMLSVDALHGGPLLVTLGDERIFLRIGARRDLWLDGRLCFLVLAESLRNRARFFFGCDPATGEAAPEDLPSGGTAGEPAPPGGSPELPSAPAAGEGGGRPRWPQEERGASRSPDGATGEGGGTAGRAG